MSRRLLVGLVAVIAVVAAGAIWWRQGQSPTPETFALLTENEVGAMEPGDPAAQDQKLRALTVQNADGPSIQVSAPSGFLLVSPVDFDIRIEPKNGVAVDMNSLRIEYKLGPAWVNLTNRIMKQATIKGSRLYARGAELPPGNHSLRLTVLDQNMRKTRALVSFSVAK